MRRSLLARLALSLLAACPAFAGTESDLGASSGSAAEIRLGEAPPPPPAVDPSRVKAVERFLAARQGGSVARAKGRAVKLAVVAPRAAKAEELYGPKEARIIAFDFRNEGIEAAGAGRFQVTAFLLFADEAGQVVESRDENLIFSGKPGAWSCVSRQTTAAMTWEGDGVLDTAASLGVSAELREARTQLRDWTIGRREGLAYSVSDVTMESGRVVVQCLRFTADPGRRGFDVDTAPLVLKRDGGAPRVEPN